VYEISLIQILTIHSPTEWSLYGTVFIHSYFSKQPKLFNSSYRYWR